MNYKKSSFLFNICLIFLIAFNLSCQSKAKNNSVDESQTRKEEQKPSKKTNEFFTIDFAEIIKHKREVQLSEFAKSVKFIQFDNSPKALLGRVCDIQFTEEYIFIQHNGIKLLTQFTREGKFVRHFGTIGRGPKEYALMRKFSLDVKKELVYIQTNWTRKVLVYNFDGKYLKTLKFNAVNRSRITWNRDNSLVSFAEPHLGNELYVFMEHNEKGDTLQNIKNTNLWDRKESSFSMPNFGDLNSFYRLDNKLHMKGWYNDTVYTFNERNKIVPKYFIDLKKHKIPNDLIYTRKSTRPMPSEACWIGVHETSNYIFIPYGYHYNIQTRILLKEDEGCVLYNKRTKEGIAVNENIIGGFTNDLTGGPDFKPLYTSDTTAFVAVSALDMKLYLESDKFKNQVVKFPEQKEKLIQLNKTLKEDDNSFLMVAKLKK